MRLNTPEGGFVECLTCGGRERGEDYRYNTESSEFAPVTWECGSCKATNPNSTFKCLRCHKSLI
jgi:hypothetical protein